MDLILRIGGDPASWVVPDGNYDALATQFSQATEPAVIEVSSPLAGTLVLSAKAAGSVVILQPPGGLVLETHDWNPGGAIKPSAPLIYLASPAGPGTGSSRYVVSANVNAQALVEEIRTAMSDGTKRMLTLPVFDPSGTGTLVIDGAALPFAVVCAGEPG